MRRPVKIIGESRKCAGAIPDVDLDIQPSQRSTLIGYLNNSYSNVAKVATISYLQARSAIKAAGRALGANHNILDQLNTLIDPANPLDFSLQSPEVEAFIREHKLSHVIDLAGKLQGLACQYGVHPGGVVVAPGPISDYLPIWNNPDVDLPLTMYDLVGVEKSGLIKYDFLGLLAVDILAECCSLTQVPLEEIPLDDPETYYFFSKGLDLYGVFQFEKSLTRSICEASKPLNIVDLAAIVSVIRPGPLHSGFHELYVKGGQSHHIPEVDETLRETKGILLFQEQLMSIAQKMAGLTENQADDLRAGIGKKKKEIIEKYREIFLNGCLAKGHLKEDAESIYQWFEEAASYAFNKSHAVVYSIMSYYCAYFRTHYPVEFFCAYLNAYLGHEKLKEGVRRVKKAGFQFLLPDINKSDFGFKPENGYIRFGLGAIKGVGEKSITPILNKRKEGDFQSLRHFIQTGAAQKSDTEILIKVGAFDFCLNSRTEGLSITSEKQSKQAQLDFGEEVKYQPENDDQKGSWEKELLYLPLTKNPLESVQIFADRSKMYVSDLGVDHLKRKVSIVGMIRAVEHKVSKSAKKSKYINLMIEDPYEEIAGMIFEKNFPFCVDALKLADTTPMTLTGWFELDTFGEEDIDEPTPDDVFRKGKLKILSIEPVDTQDSCMYVLKIPKSIPKQKLESLQRFIKRNQSDNGCIVILSFDDSILRTSYKIELTDWIEAELNREYKVVIERR